MPVKPRRCNEKLMFSLCRTCSQNHQQGPCEHQDNNTAFTGTWVTDEVKVAIKKGYTWLSIYEVWKFTDISRYDPVWWDFYQLC